MANSASSCLLTFFITNQHLPAGIRQPLSPNFDSISQRNPTWKDSPSWRHAVGGCRTLQNRLSIDSVSLAQSSWQLSRTIVAVVTNYRTNCHELSCQLPRIAGDLTIHYSQLVIAKHTDDCVTRKNCLGRTSQTIRKKANSEGKKRNYNLRC